MAKKKERAYMLTINNPTEADTVVNRAILDNPELFMIQYFVVGYEHFNVMASKRKLTPHFQITVVFKDPVSFYHVKKLFPRAHIEVLWATLERAAKYCKKESFYLESGGYDDAILLLGEALPAVQGDGGKGVSVTPLPSSHLPVSPDDNLYSNIDMHPKGWD